MSKEAAAKARKALKALGWNARKVGVRADYSSITFTVKDPEVDLSKVNDIASNAESVRRCEYTHEILAGGNTFTSVYITESVRDEWAKRYADKLEKAWSQIDMSKNERPRVGSGWYIGPDGWMVVVSHVDRYDRVYVGSGSEKPKSFNEVAARMHASDNGGSFQQVAFSA